MANIPQEILTRKHEITTQFLDLLDQYIEDILNGRIKTAYTIKDFAGRLSIQPAHLNNTIKLTTKRAPSDFMDERIVAEGKRMLSETTMSVTEICKTLAFQDIDNFIKFFSSVEGKTPLEYRNQFAHADSLNLH
jgi:AraC-like DNA-binding protein